MDENENTATEVTQKEKVTVASVIFGGAAIFTVLLANIGVLARYVFQYSIPSIEELLRFVFVWLIFICSALSYREGGLIGITMIADSLKGKPGLRRALFLFQHLGVFVFSLAMVYTCWEMFYSQYEFEELSVVMEINMGWMTLGALIGFILMMFYALWNFLRNMLSPDSPLSVRIRRSFRGFYPEP